MNIRCPNCGAVHSLDTLINDADASEVLKAVLDMDAALGKAAIRYIGLFRPAKSQLSWSRTAKLLNELMPSIKAESVERDGVSYPAPAAAWIHGFTETLAARDIGRLKTPLKSHGYLYEIIAGWAGNVASVPVSINNGTAAPAIIGGSRPRGSKVVDAVQQLEEMKNE